MTFAAVLFDFDGTLADSYPAITASVNYLRSLYGLDPLANDEVKRHVGRGPEYLLEHTVPGSDVNVDLPRYRAHHPTVMRDLTHLLPGAAELIRALAGAGLKVGLCSNKPRLFSSELLKYLNLAEFFTLVLGPEDVTNPKPAPDILFAALKQLNLSPDEVLYVGDMTVDIQTARGAGVKVWVVPTGSDELSTLEQAKPDRLLRDLFDIMEILPGR